MKKPVTYAWERIEEEPNEQAELSAYTASPMVPAPDAAGARDRLAMGALALLLAACTFWLWLDAQDRQRATRLAIQHAVATEQTAFTQPGTAAAADTVEQIRIHGDLAQVHSAGAQLTLRKTEAGWQRVAPDGTLWGPQHRLEIERLTVTFRAQDAQLVRQAVGHATRRDAFIRRMLELPPAAAPLAFHLQPDPVTVRPTVTSIRRVQQPLPIRSPHAMPNMTHSQRLRYLEDALLAPLITQALAEITGSGPLSPQARQLVQASREWLLVHAYPRMEGDPMTARAKEVTAPAQPPCISPDPASRQVLVGRVMNAGGYPALAHLLRSVAAEPGTADRETALPACG